jgi:hypothetical protein
MEKNANWQFANKALKENTIDTSLLGIQQPAATDWMQKASEAIKDFAKQGITTLENLEIDVVRNLAKMIGITIVDKQGNPLDRATIEQAIANRLKDLTARAEVLNDLNNVSVPGMPYSEVCVIGR